jgi:hypothetical protein
MAQDDKGVNMSELNEEKLKQILEGYSKSIEDKIDTSVIEMVRALRIYLDKQQNYSLLFSFFSFGVAVLALGMTLFIYGVDKQDSTFLDGGLWIVGISFCLFIFGSIVFAMVSRRKR